jgi:hypothetical protein
MKKSVPAAILKKAKGLTWTDGNEIFFGMMNENTNGFAGLISWMRFYRMSSLYLELDPMAKSRVSYDTL